MDRVGVLKRGIGGICLMTLFIIIFVGIFSVSSSALGIISKESYALGESVKIDLSKVENYTLKIITPSTSYLLSGSKEVFVFKPQEPGKYALNLQYSRKQEFYEFEVMQPKIKIRNFTKPLLTDLNLSSENKSQSSYEETSDVKKSSSENKIILNKEVHWKINKTISSNQEKIIVPSYAENISVYSAKSMEKIDVEIDRNILRNLISRIISLNKQPGHYVLNIKNLSSNKEEVIVEFYTPPPKAKEKPLSERKKEITIYSPPGLNYTNVLSYTTIPELTNNKELIKVYWKEENKYLSFNASDTDGDGLLDYVEWIVPHLSNQTFEISINIINVQSYPVVGGNWSVKFTTTGTADLTIRGINGTTFGKDLEFLELKCGNTTISKDRYVYDRDNNIITVKNWQCNQTATETSRVLTTGKHTLEFSFGGEKAYAYNYASKYKIIGEWGTVTDLQESSWTTVIFNHTFNDTPVVIHTIDYDYNYDNNPCQTRIRNVNKTGFQIRAESWSPTASCPTTGVNGYWIAMEKGIHTIGDNGVAKRTVEVANFTMSVAACGSGANPLDWTYPENLRTFQNTWSFQPLVLASVQTAYDLDVISYYIKGCSLSSNTDTWNTTCVQIGLNGMENDGTIQPCNLHTVDEEGGYIAWEMNSNWADAETLDNSGTFGDGVLQYYWEAYWESDNVRASDNDPYPMDSYFVTLSQTWSQGVAFGSGIRIDGNNGILPALDFDPSTNQIFFLADEDQYGDSEQNHITEPWQALFFNASSGFIFSSEQNPAPAIFDVNATSITDSSATIVWNTDITGNSSVNYGTSLSLGSFVGSSELVLNHSVLLGGLTANTLYYYNVTSCSENGICNTTGVFNFTTITGTPPTIYNITPANNSNVSSPVTLTASTSENADCQYSTSSNFTYGTGTNFSSGQGTTQHSTSLGSLASGTYTYYIKCQDTSGNANDDSNQGITTFSVDADAPQITLHYPTAGDVSYNTPTEFNWTATDNLDVNIECSLYIDDVLAESGISSSNGSVTNTTSSVSFGIHNWTLNCSDDVNNSASETSWFYFGDQKTSSAIGEIGRVEVNASAWTLVNTLNTYTTPVIVTGYEFPYDNTVPPVTVRMRNVNSNSFELMLQIANSTATASDVGNLNVTYLIIEQGDHFLEDGTKIEAYRYNTNTVSNAPSNWIGDSKTYNFTYTSPPIVLHQVMSYNDPNWITTYVSSDGNKNNPPTTTGFQISLHNAELGGSHGTETVGYIIIEQASGTNGGVYYESQISGDVVEGVDNDPTCSAYPVTFLNTYTSSPLVIEAIQSMDGNNGGWAQKCSVTTSQVNLRIDEDQFADEDRTHITEDVAVFIFGSAGKIYSNTTLDFPQISGVNATNISDSSAVIVWDTNITGNSTVYYGLTNSSYFKKMDSAYVLNHSLQLTSLYENTTYFYIVESCSETTASCNFSGTFNFTTLFGTPPVIYNITPKNGSIVANPVTLTASTSENADCQYSTSSNFTYGTGTNFSSGQGTTQHSTSLGSLASGTYTYYIKCQDTSGNANDDSNQGITTFTVDEIAPSITLNFPPDGSKQTSPVTFNWTATDNSDSVLNCNLTIDSVVKDSNVSSQNGTETTSTQELGDGAHIWNVTCWDDAGNLNTSETRSFSIGDLVKANVTTDKTQYYQGEQANISINTTDALGNPLQTNTTTDILLGKSLANSTVWWNTSWIYRKAYRIQENSGTALTEYQINITLDTLSLINESKMNPDCSDIRIIDNNLAELDFYIQNSSSYGCNTSSTLIWVKLSSLEANKSTLIYVYYGNNTSVSSKSSEYATFNYSGFKSFYYVVSSDITIVDVVSFVDGNNVSNGTDYALINRGEVTTFGVTQNTIISATGAIFASGEDNAVDALVPVSFAGKEFAYAVNRYNDIWHVYSPFGNATVCVYDGSDGAGWSLVGSCFTVEKGNAVSATRNVGASANDLSSTGTNTAKINSTLPILVTHSTDAATDGFVLYPASKDWWGVPGTVMTIGILEDNTNIEIYYSNGTNVNYTRNQGEDIYLGGFSTGGLAPAVHIVSNKLIGVAEEADQDGSEMVTFLPEAELDTEYYFPQTASYVTVSATQPDTNCTLYDNTGAIITSSLTGSNSRPYPNKWYYGPNTNGNNIPAGSRLKCSSPVFAFYEQFGGGGDDDEHNLWSIKSSRILTYPKPNITETGTEEKFAERNSSETSVNGIYSFIFDTSSKEIGNYTVVTLAETTGYKNGTSQTAFEIVSVPPNQPPVVSLVSPPSGTANNSSTIVLYYNVSDSNNNIANATLILNGQRNITNQSAVINEATNNFTITLPDGVYNWTVNVTDTTNLEGTDTNVRNFTIDTQAPAITLYNPLANESFDKSRVDFNFTVIDNLDSVMICDLIVDSTVEENDFSVQNGSFANFTKYYGAGTHFWNVTCWDDAGNLGVSETRNFTVTDEPPTVELITPNNTFTNTTSIILEYNATDNNDIVEARLILNGQVNQTNQSAVLNGQINNFTLTGLAEGVYNWTVNVTDTGGFNATALPERVFSVDFSKPAINLDYPANNSVFNSSSISFNFTVIDNIDLSLTCNLSVGEVNDSNFEASNGSVTSRQISNLTDGSKLWNVTCLDDAGNLNTSETRVVNITEYPSIQLDTANNSFFNTTTFNLSYTPSDNSNLSQCDLYIDGIFNQTNSSAVLNGQQNNFTVSGISEGSHTWYVVCNDTFNLQNASETRTFTVDVTGMNVTLLYPPNDLQIFSDTVEFSYNATDNIDPVLECNITVNSIVVDSYNATSGAITNRTVTFSQGGLKWWNVTCMDDSNNIVVSETRNFTLAFAPVVSLVSPASGTVQNFSTITLFYDVTDDNNNIANATLILNGQRNITNQSAVINEATNNFTITLPDGVYNWTVNVTDTTNLEGTDTNVRNFTIDTQAPAITLNEPQNNTILSWNNFTYNFSVTDNIDDVLVCKIYVNGALNHTVNATNGTETLVSSVLPDGDYLWNVSCIDNANNTGYSTTFNFTMEAPPNVTLNYPENESYVNTSTIDFKYFVDDPIGITNCTLYINDTFVDFTSEPAVGSVNTFTVTNIEDGRHNWTVECIDASPDFNSYKPTPLNFSVDTRAPAITLNAPPNNSNTLRTVDFNIKAEDNLDSNITCNLYTDGVLNSSNISIPNGTSVIERVQGFSLGFHVWNVSCIDEASNINFSETRRFNVTLADFMVNLSSIVFNTSEPKENESVLINATVFNLENVSVYNVTVQFYDGDPDTGGVKINGNQTIDISPLGNSTASVEWQADLSESQIYVVVDPPLATNGSFEEWNETNNKANKSISVGGWHFVVGSVTSQSEYELAANSTNSNIIKWSAVNYNYGNLYVADYESTVSWRSLQAIGKNITGGNSSTDDFSEIDALLNMTTFIDSVSNIYTNGSGVPLNTSSFTIFNRFVNEVPVTNSTNNTNFITGILWDASDDASGDGEYSQADKEDLVFVSKVNKNAQGKYGIYDYEMRIPARLREYINTETRRVVFYTELR